MQLYYTNVLIGNITNTSGDYPWTHGTICLTEDGKSFWSLFDWLVDEGKSSEEPPFGEELLDSANWYIKQGDTMKNIDVPAVYRDCSIAWRWA